MTKPLRMYIPISNNSDVFSLLHPILLQATLPAALKKVPIIKADFTLEDDTEDTSQTELIDIGNIDIEKRRYNARKALDEAKVVIEKLIVGDLKEAKAKRASKQKIEYYEEERIFGIAYVSGSNEECIPIDPKPQPVNYYFYELWKLRK